jgi:hypothetical protein
MLNRAIKMAFWVLYDHLGKLLVANLVWALSVGIPAFAAATAFMTRDTSIIIVVGVPSIVLAFGVILPIMSAGLAHMAKILIETRDGALGDFFEGIRLYWRRALPIGLLYLLACVCLPVSIWFYATRLKDTAPWLGYAISGIAVWCLLFVALTSLLVMPALVQKKEGVRATLKITALLVLDNPFFSFGLALQFIILATMSLIPLLLVGISGSAAVVLSSSAYEMLARKYQAILVAKGDAPAPERPGHVMFRNGRLEFDDERDDYLNRGFRDFIFPWKG